MSALMRALIVVVLGLASAHAYADGGTRVLLADSDPELQRAVKATLAPWRLEVVVDTATPVDAAQTRTDARFVVWRENGDLVVFDRERGETEHREAPAGALDPASAAAAALTVKTLMRLPPPEVADTPERSHDQITTPGTTASSTVELRLQVGAAMRMARTKASDVGGRANVAAFVRPTALPLRLGLAAEIGTSIDVQGAGFKGSWSDWSVVALGSWAFALTARWEIEPYVGGGVLRSKLDGEESMMERHERATLGLVRGGAFVRARVGSLSFGGFAGFDAFAGTPTYTKMGMGSEVFEVPPFALSLGVIAAADL